MTNRPDLQQFREHFDKMGIDHVYVSKDDTKLGSKDVSEEFISERGGVHYLFDEFNRCVYWFNEEDEYVGRTRSPGPSQAFQDAQDPESYNCELRGERKESRSEDEITRKF